MTSEQRAKCAEEIAAEITAVVTKYTTSNRDDEAVWKCGPEDLPLPGEDDISAILARHDAAPVGDAAREAARECIGIDGCVAWLDDAAAIIQSAISASERELVEALELFAKYSRARLEIFGEHSLNSYLHPQVCNGRITADIDKADWDRARAVLAKQGRK